jgi:hypothetical protein
VLLVGLVESLLTIIDGSVGRLTCGHIDRYHIGMATTTTTNISIATDALRSDPQVVTSQDYREMEWLINQYFHTNSQLDVDGLCNIVSDGMLAHYTSGDVIGKVAFREYIIKLFKVIIPPILTLSITN